MGSFQTLELIETFISYAESIKRCVCIVYDPQRSSAGGHALKAVRLKDSFIQARIDGSQTYTGEGHHSVHVALAQVDHTVYFFARCTRPAC